MQDLNCICFFCERVYMEICVYVYFRNLQFAAFMISGWNIFSIKYFLSLSRPLFRLLWWTAGWRCLQWQWWVVAAGPRPGHVQDAEVESQTAFCSSPWSGTGTRDASSARAATLSLASTAAPATAKEAWSSARTTTSGESRWSVQTAVLVETVLHNLFK